MTGPSPQILYISYDGVLEPLGESQVVSYLERLAPEHSITLLSFEKPDDVGDRARVLRMEQRLGERRIAWIRLRYHRWPQVLSTAVDVLCGVLRARAECRRRGITIIHARSYVPAIIALGARSASQARFLFDMRGFWVDEKVEAGHWNPGGLLYRFGKWWERRFFQAADAIVSLTEAGVRAFAELGYQVPSGVGVTVIPTCVDVERFAPGPKDRALAASLGLDGAIVLGSIGTISNWYMRDEMLQYLARLAQSVDRARILIVTREDHDKLRQDAERAGIPAERLVLTRAAFSEMPRFTRLFDAGLFFIRPALSKRASAATKLAEFLACGVPVIINAGVGDSGVIVKQGNVGVVLKSVDAASFDGALPEVRALLADSTIGARCRRVAVEVFDINRGAEGYRRLYAALSAGSRRESGGSPIDRPPAPHENSSFIS